VIYVGAFGKHPAWHDHILPAIGLEGRLTGVMETLYFGGIQKSIAAWRDAAEGDLIPFGHLFVWQTPSDLVLGRLWHSHDGAQPPRSDYPMVVCVQCANVSRAWALDFVPPFLDRLERDCKAATTRQGVEDVITAAREDLRRAAASPEATAADADPAARARAVVQLADDERVGPEGLARVTYVLHEAAEGHARQARVPRVGKSEGEGVRAWADFMEARFGVGPTRGLTRVVVGAGGEEWVDLILGAPDWSHFRALRYSTAVVAPDTRTPYSLDGDFLRASGDFLARCRAMETDGHRPPVRTPAGWEQGEGEAAAVAGGGRAWKWVAIWVVLAALLLLGVAVLVLVSRAEQAVGTGR
jgi:hypothetical protein